MAKKSLGRGFDVLIPKDLDKTILGEDKDRVQKLLINDIVPNPNQPRREIDQKELSGLAGSIKRYGVLQPIIVIRAGNKYSIVAGERRWRAAQLAGLTHVPSIVRSLQELEQLELALIENIQRVDLSPLEQAMSVWRLQQQFNLALDQIAEKLGKAPSTISNLTRLLQLPEAARKALSEKRISEGHARAILALKNDPKLQEELLDNILSKKWTVRVAEQFVITHRQASRVRISDEVQQKASQKLTEQLNLPVRISTTAKSGQLIIGFKNEQELNRIIEHFHKQA